MTKHWLWWILSLQQVSSLCKLIFKYFHRFSSGTKDIQLTSKLMEHLESEMQGWKEMYEIHRKWAKTCKNKHYEQVRMKSLDTAVLWAKCQSHHVNRLTKGASTDQPPIVIGQYSFYIVWSVVPETVSPHQPKSMSVFIFSLIFISLIIKTANCVIQ